MPYHFPVETCKLIGKGWPKVIVLREPYERQQKKRRNAVLNNRTPEWFDERIAETIELYGEAKLLISESAIQRHFRISYAEAMYIKNEVKEKLDVDN